LTAARHLEDIAMVLSTTPPDSSRPRLEQAPLPSRAEDTTGADPNAVDDAIDAAASPRPDADKRRRTRLLTSDRVHAAIRKVARGHDVPHGEIDDVLQETIARAWTATLPADDDEARKYVNGIAANVSCDRMRKVPDVVPYIEDPDEERGETATPIAVRPASFEARDVVSKLVEVGEHQFPKGFPGYLAAKMTGGTADEIANVRGVTPGHVRHEWLDIQGFMNRHGRRLGVAVALLVIILVMRNVWRRPEPKDHVASPCPPTEPPCAPALDAAGLRHRAHDECAASAWRACIDDLDAAKKVDPAGDTPELRDLRALAQQHLADKPLPR
jgi:DNA-directed RNA polymerase specialized sigma24 family protein